MYKSNLTHIETYITSQHMHSCLFTHTDPKSEYYSRVMKTHIHKLQDYHRLRYKLLLKHIFKIIFINGPKSIKDTKGLKKNKSSYQKVSKICESNNYIRADVIPLMNTILK